MRSWFGSSSTVITLHIKTTDGKLDDTIQIQSDETVTNLKTIIDEKFQCDPDLQKLVFHGQILKDDQPLSAYSIKDNSIILLMNAKDSQKLPPKKPDSKRSIFEKSNPYYQSQSDLSEPGKPSTPKQGQYFDPILNELAKYHPDLPLAVMEHKNEVGHLMNDLNKRIGSTSSDKNDQTITEQEQSLAAYYYYLSLASLSAVTSTVASSVYQHLPSKEQISTTVHSIIRPNSADGSQQDPNSQTNTDNNTTSLSLTSRPSMSWIKHLQKLVTNTKEEKAAIDRLVSLGFGKTESVEAFLACDKDEALAAVFMSQETNKPTLGGPAQPDHGYIDDEEEEKKMDQGVGIDASMGYINEKHEKLRKNTPTKGGIMENEYDKTIINNSVYFKQFQKWIRNVFDDDESYYRYLLLFMKEKIAEMTCLEDINYDEEYLISIGIEHRIHRKRIIKAIGVWVNNKNKFELWWNETIQFKKYLKLFQKHGVWDLEELLLQIRSPNDIKCKIGIENENDVDSIWKHIEHLRKQHTLYGNIQSTGSILTPNVAATYVPNAPVMPINAQYPNNNIPAPMYPNMNNGNNMNPANVSNISLNSNNSQQEGAVTQM